MLPGFKKRNPKDPNQPYTLPGKEPIEPKGVTPSRISWAKAIIFLLLLSYLILTAYSSRFLTYMGHYLVVSHEPRKSDLIVCLSERNIERGLAAAEAYNRGLAPRIFAGREVRPDGFDLLRERGVLYPETVDLLRGMLKDLGVPESALIVPEESVSGTFEEAVAVQRVIRKAGYRSLILITSPTHTRRVWLTFKRLLENDNVRILVVPTPYSGFDPENWWKQKRYAKEVLLEYEKLLYYLFKSYL